MIICDIVNRNLNRIDFLLGFYDIVPEALLSIFDFQELELVLHGLPKIDMDDWMANTEYTGKITTPFVDQTHVTLLFVHIYHQVISNRTLSRTMW